MSVFKTEQENFWAGQFGSEYIGRNKSNKLLAANIALFAKILARTNSVNSVLELGANIGLNLIAIKQLLPDAALSAVEINAQAAGQLKQIGKIDVYCQSILDFKSECTWDFVFTKGVLIHIAPEYLPQVYDLLHQASNRYIFMAEYYNPSPTEINYRGHKDKLFKRDFAGELLDRFGDLRLTDYGFAYHRDPNSPQDDLTWFLFEKNVRGERLWSTVKDA